jgi:MYND finger protein
MATCPVRFDFMTDLRGQLKFIHNIPRSLVTPTAQASQSDPKYIEKFQIAIKPILLEHYPVCFAASDQKCRNCGSPTTIILQTPISYLHRLNDPFVNVLLNPVCNKTECEMRTQQEIQDLMTDVTAEIRREEEAKGIRSVDPREVIPCKICGKTKTMKCGRCKVVAYCGKDHQKADWATHKKICVSAAR